MEKIKEKQLAGLEDLCKSIYNAVKVFSPLILPTQAC